MSVKRSYRFAAVPEWVLFHADLQPIDVRVFGVLDRYANNGVAWPGLARIADQAQCSEDTARRAIRRLQDAGAVVVEADADESGRQKSNRYHLAGDAPMHKGGGTAATLGGSSGARGEGGTDATQKREGRNESQRNENPAATRTDAVVPFTPRSTLALVDPNQAARENVAPTLDLAASLAEASRRPLLPSERASLVPYIVEALTAGYDPHDLAHAIASAAYRTPKGVAGELGRKRNEPTSVGNRGMTVADRWANR